jgi:hypothetical protein
MVREIWKRIERGSSCESGREGLMGIVRESERERERK